MTKKRKGKRGPKATPPAERFERYVDRDGPHVDGMQEPCHFWLASFDRFNQPVFGERPNEAGGIVKAHRYAYERASGKKLKKRQRTRRVCGTENCINGDHIEALPIKKKKGKA